MKALLAALLVAGAAGAAVAAAPTALGQPHCSTTSAGSGIGEGGGGTKVCETPGDAEITTVPPENATPYWGGILPFENYGPAVM